MITIRTTAQTSNTSPVIAVGCGRTARRRASTSNHTPTRPSAPANSNDHHTAAGCRPVVHDTEEKDVRVGQSLTYAKGARVLNNCDISRAPTDGRYTSLPRPSKSRSSMRPRHRPAPRSRASGQQRSRRRSPLARHQQRVDVASRTRQDLAGLSRGPGGAVGRPCRRGRWRPGRAVLLVLPVSASSLTASGPVPDQSRLRQPRESAPPTTRLALVGVSYSARWAHRRCCCQVGGRSV